jgi:phenylalanyl-tRNA synthetase beta chain
VTGFHDNYPHRLIKNEIDVSLDWLEKRLGMRIPNDELASKLHRLGFDVSFKADIACELNDKHNADDECGTSDDRDASIMQIIVPTWRSTGDISIPDDIVEEIARIHGLENFEPTPIVTSFEGPINQPLIDIDRKIREYLAFRCGMNEIYTYPWVASEYIDAVLQNSENMLELSAPPSPDERFLRTSLLPNLCRAVSDNLRYFNEFAIFESAQVFFDKDYSSKYDPLESLPAQRKNIAGAFVGSPDDLDTLYRKVKGTLESMPRLVHIEAFTFEKQEKPIWADDVVWLNICINNKRIGNIALLSKKAALGCGIKNSAVVLFEIDLDSLIPLSSRTNKFTHIPEYPLTDYDVSLLFDSTVTWEKIFETATAKMGPDSLLRDVSFVEEYKGRQIPDGKKSVTLRLVIGSLSKTLTSDEIENCANAIVKRLKKTYGAEGRG